MEKKVIFVAQILIKMAKKKDKTEEQFAAVEETLTSAGYLLTLL